MVDMSNFAELRHMSLGVFDAAERGAMREVRDYKQRDDDADRLEINLTGL